MATMKQKDAVFQAVCNVTGHKEGKCNPSKEQRAQVNMILLEGFRAGSIGYDGDFNTLSDSDQKSYISGLTSNWLRKDVRLNGGEKYVAKNPGSRAGAGDPMIQNLKKLMTTVTTEEDKAEIQSYIDARQAEINATKQAAVVDFSALPADLQAKYSK